MTRVIVSSVIGNKPLNAGNAWVILSWLRGLERLGCEVYFVEQISQANCLDVLGRPADFEGSVNRDYFKRIVDQFALERKATLVCENGEQTYGLSLQELLDLAESADLLINITGHLRFDPLLRRIRKKAYVDLDPGFTQFWHAQGSKGARLTGHDYYFTVGENIGTKDCPIPTCEIVWHPLRQPVVMSDWPVTVGSASNRFTTVATWRGPYSTVTFGDTSFGQKVHEFRKFVEMPDRAPQIFEIALDIHPAEARDLNDLRRHGWQLLDPKTSLPDPESFRHYVQNSCAEFSAAQGVYVQTFCGWFSDRTTRYLASGRPVLIQDTGFSRNYPVGDGLLEFRTLDEAVNGADRIVSDYAHHCRAARQLAEEYFDSDKVLGHFLEQVELGG